MWNTHKWNWRIKWRFRYFVLKYIELPVIYTGWYGFSPLLSLLFLMVTGDELPMNAPYENIVDDDYRPPRYWKQQQHKRNDCNDDSQHTTLKSFANASHWHSGIFVAIGFRLVLRELYRPAANIILNCLMFNGAIHLCSIAPYISTQCVLKMQFNRRMALQRIFCRLSVCDKDPKKTLDFSFFVFCPLLCISLFFAFRQLPLFTIALCFSLLAAFLPSFARSLSLSLSLSACNPTYHCVSSSITRSCLVCAILVLFYLLSCRRVLPTKFHLWEIKAYYPETYHQNLNIWKLSAFRLK